MKNKYKSELDDTNIIQIEKFIKNDRHNEDFLVRLLTMVSDGILENAEEVLEKWGNPIVSGQTYINFAKAWKTRLSLVDFLEWGHPMFQVIALERISTICKATLRDINDEDIDFCREWITHNNIATGKEGSNE